MTQEQEGHHLGPPQGPPTTLIEPSLRYRAATLLAEVLAPAPTVAALLLVIAWQSARTSAQALFAGLLAALFASALPFGYILRGVRRGRLTDHHVRIREQRRTPLLVGIASVTAGTGLLIALRAPRDLIALVVAMLVGLAASLLVTMRWKISVHTAVVGGAATVLTLTFGSALLLTAPLVGAIGWARVAVGDHTRAQAVAGACLGIAVAATIYPTMR